MTHHVSWNEIRSGFRVCDMNGETIGTIKNVQHGRAMGGQQTGGRQMGGGQPMGGGQQMSQGYVECDCTLPGMSKQLFIPLNEFRDCTDDCCTLNLNKNDIQSKQWDRPPAM